MTSNDPTTAAHRPAVHILTLGCPKNEVDSRTMAGALHGRFDLTDDLDTADVVLVNTCAFIQEATEESIGVILELAGEWKQARPGRSLLVTGCLPSRYGDDLAGELPEVDGFVAVADEAGIVAAIAAATGIHPAHDDSTASVAVGPSAYLKVADGCHRACTFCTIPAIRGPFRSTPLEDAVSEAQGLVAAGARELVLVGQDISAWGQDLPGRPALADLVRALAHVEGLSWLRLMYVQPDGITPELLEVMTDEPVVCEYLDMPLQHASAEVLHRMARRGSAAEFMRLIGVVRDLVPGVALRTTLIAGFPGETRQDAADLEEFVREADLDYVGVFTYSKEEGTVAADLPSQVPARTALARAQRLRDIADVAGFARAEALVGSRLQVLVCGVDEDGVTFGRHRGQAPEIDGVVLLDTAEPVGSMVQVEFTEAAGYDLLGTVV